MTLLYDTLNSNNPHQLDTPFQGGVLQQPQKKKFQIEAARKATKLESSTHAKAAKEVIPESQKIENKKLPKVEFADRQEAALENKTVSVAKTQLPVTVEQTFASPMSTITKTLEAAAPSPIDTVTNTLFPNPQETSEETAARFPGRLQSVESMLEDLKDEDLNLKDLMFLMQQVQTLLASEHERILGPHLLNMGDHALEQSDDFAAEKRAKKVAFLTVLGGILELSGSLLSAGKAAGLVIPILDKLLPAFLKGGELISTTGRVTNALGNVANNYSQSEQQMLQHLYQRSMDRMSELQRMRNQRGQEKNQALQKIAEQEAAYQRLVQELLTRQG